MRRSSTVHFLNARLPSYPGMWSARSGWNLTHQHPPEMPLCRSTSAAKSFHVSGPDADRTRASDLDTDPVPRPSRAERVPRDHRHAVRDQCGIPCGTVSAVPRRCPIDAAPVSLEVWLSKRLGADRPGGFRCVDRCADPCVGATIGRHGDYVEVPRCDAQPAAHD
jgi:hypothetical protein